jgi:aerobic carbon-monoxide dehydrogenase large subunit
VQSVATLAAVEKMTAAFLAFLDTEFDAPGVTFDEGAFRAPGSNRTLTLAEAADLARQRGREDLLSAIRARHAAGPVLPQWRASGRDRG